MSARESRESLFPFIDETEHEDKDMYYKFTEKFHRPEDILSPVINIKPLSDKFVMPYRATPDSVGYDLTATDMEYKGEYVRYRLGFAMEITQGWYVRIYPRSSVSKTGLIQANSVGIIDPDYRDELFVDFRNITGFAWPTVSKYKVGDRVAQMVICRKYDGVFELTDRLTETERKGGHGSTGV
jgi:dUTP pyrophosphatase